MAIAVEKWAEQYKRYDRSIGVAVSGGGSGTGIAALINGTVDIANASRSMTRREVNLAKEHGIAPVQHIVGYDGIAIYIHKDNPVSSFSFSQLAEIYSNDGKAESWSDLGIDVPSCRDQKIIRVGRQNSSGTYAYIRKHVLDGKKFKQGILAAQSSKDLVEMVARTPCAIGYSSYAYATPDVKTACIAESMDKPCLVPEVSDVADHTYALTRPLYMYTKVPATGDVKNYLDWILGEEAQCILQENHYAPVRNTMCEEHKTG